MHPDQVIVTLCTENGRFTADYELPAALPAEKLAMLLLNTLQQQYPQQFSLWRGLRLWHSGAPLQDKETLADRAIWDGAILMLKEA